MAPRRKVDNLLALAVLVLAAERPMHPVRDGTGAPRARQTPQHQHQVGIALHRGAKPRASTASSRPPAPSARVGGPERTVYALTDAGRAEMRDWLRELIAVPREGVPQLRGGALARSAPCRRRRSSELLTDRLRRLEAELAEVREELAESSRDLPRIFLIEAEYAAAMRQAEARGSARCSPSWPTAHCPASTCGGSSTAERTSTAGRRWHGRHREKRPRWRCGNTTTEASPSNRPAGGGPRPKVARPA